MDRGIDAGSLHVSNLLDLVSAMDGGELAMGYAGGMVAGLRIWLIAHHGREATYELFQRMADDTATDMIGKGRCQ